MSVQSLMAARDACRELGLPMSDVTVIAECREEATRFFMDYHAVRAKTLLLFQERRGIGFNVSGALYSKVWPHSYRGVR